LVMPQTRKKLFLQMKRYGAARPEPRDPDRRGCRFGGAILHKVADATIRSLLTGVPDALAGPPDPADGRPKVAQPSPATGAS